jgi:hypothetical protein
VPRAGDADLSEDFYREQMARRYDLAKMVFPPVLWIAALWIPLRGALPIAEALSGKQTSLTVSFSISIAVSISAAGAMGTMWYRYRKQKEELIRLRERAEGLEKQLKEAKGS